jgi:hypothetical protein
MVPGNRETNMGTSRTGVKCILGVNIAAMVGFAILGGIVPLSTELRVRSHYVNLDRTGVIDANALEKFQPDLVKDPRHAVPLYIAGPALEAQKSNAFWGSIMAMSNSVICVGVLLMDRHHGGPPKSAA